MRVSLLQNNPSCQPGEILVHVEVSEIDDPPIFTYSHSFKYKIPSGKDEKGEAFGEIIVHANKDAASRDVGDAYRFDLEKCYNKECEGKPGGCSEILSETNRLPVTNVFHTEPTTQNTLHFFGVALFKAVFSGYAGQLLKKIMPEDSNGRIFLQLKDLEGHDDLDAIPWEYMKDGPRFLVHQRMFTRVHEHPQDPLPKLPLRIVVIAPDPLNFEKVDRLSDLHLRDQFQYLVDICYKNSKKVILDPVLPASVQEMNSMLKRDEVATVLHFMGHCVASKEDEKARSLVFEHGATYERHDAITECLVTSPENLRLAFLSACNSRQVARELVQKGVRYTIGSYCPLPDDIARKFEAQFYQFLAEGQPINEAMWKTRKQLGLAESNDSRRQHDYLAGAMILYSTTYRATDLFICESGNPIVNKRYSNNPYRVNHFYGRKKELVGLNKELTRMATYASESAYMCTIVGIGGQGKTALASEAKERVTDVFPGGIFFWSFDNEEPISATKYLSHLFSDKVGAIYPQGIPTECSREDVLVLGFTIFKKFNASVLLILDHADTLNRAEERGEESAAVLVELLKQVASSQNFTVKILATSQKALKWPGEKPIPLEGFTDLDRGHQLFFQSLDFQTREKLTKEVKSDINTKQLLCDLVKGVDGHPLSLILLGRAASRSENSKMLLKDIVDHCDTLLAKEDFAEKSLKRHFRPMIDILEPQLRLFLYMCSLFTGPITAGVLKFVSYFVDYVRASVEKIDYSTEATAILEKLYSRNLLLKVDDNEYRIPVALREGLRQHNTELKLQLRLQITDFYDDVFIVGVVKSSKRDQSVVLDWLFDNMQTDPSVMQRNLGIEYISIGKSGHQAIEIAAANDCNTLTTQLAVLICEASETFCDDFPQFCMEKIIKVLYQKKLPFILCLKYAESVHDGASTVKPRTTAQMKRTVEILRVNLELTYWIILAETPYENKIQAKEGAFVNSGTLSEPTNSINYDGKAVQRTYRKSLTSVPMDGEFVGREDELRNLDKLLNGPNRFITIKGIGGMGKTWLALQATKNFKSGHVLALSLIGAPRFHQVLLKIARFLNIDTKDLHDQDIQSEVLENLEEQDTVLLYLDNMEDVKRMTVNRKPDKSDAKVLMKFFQQMPHNVRILSTSRDALGWPNEVFVELDGLSSLDGMLVFQQWAHQRGIDVEKYRKSIMKLSDLIYGHPLSLRLLGGVFNNCGEDVDQFVNNITIRLQKAEDSSPIDPRHESINACINYSYNSLDPTLILLLGQLKLFEVPFTMILVETALNSEATSLSASSVRDNLHKLWQHSWLNRRSYEKDPFFGDWRPKITENDEMFYSFPLQLRNFLSEQSDSENHIYGMLNNQEIQFYIALCYGVGYGVANDLEKQIEWCIKAATNGHLEAQLILAKCYQQGGCGVAQDQQKAFDWYLKAAEAGDKNAQMEISTRYLYGRGIKENRRIYHKWLDEAQSNPKRPIEIKCDLTLPLLHRAAEYGQVTRLRTMLKQPLTLAKMNVKDSLDRTPLHVAAEKGQIEVLKLLTLEFLVDVNIKANDGRTPFHVAVEKGQMEFAQVLVTEFGVDPNIKDNSNRMPLHWASLGGYIEMVQWLLVEFEADASARDKAGDTPLHLAAQGGHIKVFRLLATECGADVNAKDNLGRTPLHQAILNEHIDTAQLLLAEFGVDASAKDNNGDTSLHFAANGGHIMFVRLLVVEFKADVNAENNFESNSLYYATHNGHTELVKVLLTEFGANANAKASDGSTLLHKTLHAGHIEIVRLLLAEHGVDASAKDNNGWTPLHQAAYDDRIEIARLLISRFKADFNVKDNDGYTPLHIAAGQGHIGIVRLFLAEYKADVNVKSNYGLTPLHVAVEKGYIEIVRLFLAEFKADSNVKNNNGYTPLHMAVQTGYIEIIRLLVTEFEADINIKCISSCECTLLHNAAQNGYVEIVRMFLTEFKIDVNVNNNEGLTPLHKAASEGHIEIVILFLTEFKADSNVKNNNGCTPLHMAAEQGHIEIVRLLLIEFGAEFRVDSNVKDNDGYTPLHKAAWQGHIEIVRLLLSEFKADSNDKDNDGYTPLHIAAWQGHIEIVRLFLAEYKADVNVKTNHRSTPLHLAAKEGHIEIVRMLVTQFDADVNSRCNHNATSVHYAVKCQQNIEMVKLLVTDLGADANAKDNDGDAPLEWAVENGQVDMVRTLVAEFGADANLQNSEGNIPLHYAAQKGHVEMIKILVREFGADVNAKGNEQNTPLHFAVQKGAIELVRVLVTELGANPNAKNSCGKIPLQLATKEHVEIVEILEKYIGAIDQVVKDLVLREETTLQTGSNVITEVKTESLNETVISKTEMNKEDEILIITKDLASSHQGEGIAALNKKIADASSVTITKCSSTTFKDLQMSSRWRPQGFQNMTSKSRVALHNLWCRGKRKWERVRHSHQMPPENEMDSDHTSD